jgi:hypothetical protein
LRGVPSSTLRAQTRRELVEGRRGNPPELNASFNDGIASLPLAMTAGRQRSAPFDYALFEPELFESEPQSREPQSRRQDKSLVIKEGKNKN